MIGGNGVAYIIGKHTKTFKNVATMVVFGYVRKVLVLHSPAFYAIYVCFYFVVFAKLTQPECRTLRAYTLIKYRALLLLFGIEVKLIFSM